MSENHVHPDPLVHIPDNVKERARVLDHLMEAPSLRASFVQQVAEWEAHNRRQRGERMKWEAERSDLAEQRKAYFEETVKHDSRLTDQAALPPAGGYRWERHIASYPCTGAKGKGEVKFRKVDVEAWCPAELLGPAEAGPRIDDPLRAVTDLCYGDPDAGEACTDELTFPEKCAVVGSAFELICPCSPLTHDMEARLLPPLDGLFREDEWAEIGHLFDVVTKHFEAAAHPEIVPSMASVPVPAVPAAEGPSPMVGEKPLTSGEPSGTPEAKPEGYVPARLEEALHVSTRTIGRYARLAGVATPARGEKGYVYPLEDVRRMLDKIIRGNSAANHRLANNARELLANMPSKSK